MMRAPNRRKRRPILYNNIYYYAHVVLYLNFLNNRQVYRHTKVSKIRSQYCYFYEPCGDNVSFYNRRLFRIIMIRRHGTFSRNYCRKYIMMPFIHCPRQSETCRTMILQILQVLYYYLGIIVILHTGRSRSHYNRIIPKVLLILCCSPVYSIGEYYFLQDGLLMRTQLVY